MKKNKIKGKVRLIVPPPKIEKDKRKENSKKACRGKNSEAN